jgi:DNA-binding transcriptional LysR family regulator
MRLREIEAFHAVMQSGSMSAAAGLLNVSQSAISQVLAHAESRLGFKLFERNRGKLMPTIEGRLLFSQAQDVVDSVEQVRSLAKNLRSYRTDHISIAATDPIALEVLPQALQSLRKRFPKVSATLRVLHRKELIRELLSHEIDLGFMFEPPDHPAIVAETVTSTRFFLATHSNHDHLGRAPITAEAFEGEDLIQLPQDLPPGNLLNKAWKKRLQTSGPGTIKVQTSYLAIAMVQAGGGIALIDGLTAHAFASRQIRLLEIEPRTAIRIGALWAVTRERSVLMEQVCKYLTDHVEAQARSLMDPAT